MDYDKLVRMLLCAADRVQEKKDLLSQLDSFGGDGDHGPTMERAMDQVREVIKKHDSKEIHSLLYDIGWAIMGVDGGATGPLFGSLFMAMSGPAENKEILDTKDLASVFSAGLEGVKKRTRADLGDKTMIDALQPAITTLVNRLEQDGDLDLAFGQAKEAAKKGVESTKAMQARFGRAKNLKEKSVGAEDPGAMSVCLIFKGFYEGVQSSG